MSRFNSNEWRDVGNTLLIIITVGIVIIVGNASFTIHRDMMNRPSRIECIDGYKFIVSDDKVRQVTDEYNKGIHCNNSMPN